MVGKGCMKCGWLGSRGGQRAWKMVVTGSARLETRSWAENWELYSASMRSAMMSAQPNVRGVSGKEWPAR